MGKTELIEAVADATQEPKAVVARIADAIFAQTMATVRSGEDVAIPGFGTYSLKVNPARDVPNPQRPGEKIRTSESRTIKFKFSTARRKDF